MEDQAEAAETPFRGIGVRGFYDFVPVKILQIKNVFMIDGHESFFVGLN